MLPWYLAGYQQALKQEMALNMQSSCGYCAELKWELDNQHSSEGQVADKINVGLPYHAKKCEYTYLQYNQHEP